MDNVRARPLDCPNYKGVWERHVSEQYSARPPPS